jgi:hypothetical protein
MLEPKETPLALLSAELVLFGAAVAKLYEAALQKGFGLEESKHFKKSFDPLAWEALADE